MKFSKISIASKGVELTREERHGSDVEDRHLNSTSEPLPSFVDALQAFGPFFIKLLEKAITIVDPAKLKITTLNLSEDKNGLRGLIVTGIVPIPDAYDKPLVMNTPLIREGSELALSDAVVLTDKVLELIKLVQAEAARFVNGERGQATEAKKKPSENSKEFDDRAAAASAQTTRKPDSAKKGGGKGKGKDEPAGKDNTVQFPEQIPEQTAESVAVTSSAAIRQLLLSVDRDVPVEVVTAWSLADRASAMNWATARQKEILGQADAKVPREPECVIQSATMPLKADEWTAPTPPPKAADVEPAPT